MNRVNMRRMKHMVKKYGKKYEKNMVDIWIILINTINTF